MLAHCEHLVNTQLTPCKGTINMLLAIAQVSGFTYNLTLFKLNYYILTRAKPVAAPLVILHANNAK